MPAAPPLGLLHTNPEIVFGDVDGSIVALNMQSGSYLHLNDSGSFIFGLLNTPEPRTIDWICDRMERSYDVDAITCRREVSEFVARCVKLDLLRVAAPAVE